MAFGGGRDWRQDSVLAAQGFSQGPVAVCSEGRKVQCEDQHEGKAPGENGPRNQSPRWVKVAMGRAAESWHGPDGCTGWLA